MARSQSTLLEDDHEDRISVRLDGMFDLGNLRVEEGLVINAHEDETLDFLGKYVIDEHYLPGNRTAATAFND